MIAITHSCVSRRMELATVAGLAVVAIASCSSQAGQRTVAYEGEPVNGAGVSRAPRRRT